MNWSAEHADYVIAAYMVAVIIILLCVFDTWRKR